MVTKARCIVRCAPLTEYSCGFVGRVKTANLRRSLLHLNANSSDKLLMLYMQHFSFACYLA